MARFMFSCVEISFLKVFLFKFSLTVVVTEMFLLKVFDTHKTDLQPSLDCQLIHVISRFHPNVLTPMKAEGGFTKMSFE